jgi:hypothetical protein
LGEEHARIGQIVGLQESTVDLVGVGGCVHRPPVVPVAAGLSFGCDVEQGQLNWFGRPSTASPPMPSFFVCYFGDRGGGKFQVLLTGLFVELLPRPIRRLDRLAQDWWYLCPVHRAHEQPRLDLSVAVASVAGMWWRLSGCRRWCREFIHDFIPEFSSY